MATFTFGKTGTRPYGVLTVTETATSTANNTSTLSISLVLKRPYAISSSATKTASCTINGRNYSWSGSIGGSGDKTLISATQTVTHNTDGTKTISLAASIQLDINWSGTQLGTISGSGTMKLTDIPRYGTSVQSLNAKTETTITMNWSSNATVDYIWYSSNNGGTWTGINVADGTSGTYTISGLTANTSYNIKTRIRRKDSQLTTDSSALAVTTYAYPYATGMPNFTIGEKLTLTIFNPLKRRITVNIYGADGSQISNDTTTGKSISGYNNTTVQNRLYASIPNSKSGTYRVKVTYGTNITNKTGGTYSVNSSLCTPSISIITYEDTLERTTEVTENNQLIVRNVSAVQFTANGLAAQKSATVSSCQLTVNGRTYSMTINGTTATCSDVHIDSGTNVTATVRVTDSRGIWLEQTRTVTMLDWARPTALITMYRQDNFYSETNITANADYSSLNGQNTVTINYQAKKHGTSTYTISGRLYNGVQSTFTADNNYAWDVVVVVTDRLGGSTSYTLYLSRGMPIIYFDRLKSSVGINCFPKEDQSLEVNGINVARSAITLSLSETITDLSVNSYTIVPLNLTNAVAGDKLTANGDGGILVGANISKILVSGRTCIRTGNLKGNRHLRIAKNTINGTVAWNYITIDVSTYASIDITPALVNVTAGDVIYLFYYVPIDTDSLGGNAYGGRTSLTVETIA